MVANNWNSKDASLLLEQAGDDPADRELALQIYASRLIGSDPALVQHGGGNTSCKVTRNDLFGKAQNVIHIKGSGADLARVTAQGMPGVWLDPLRALRVLDHISDADMVNAQRCNLLDTSAPNPSVETLLHAYLPAAVVNHTHATAMLSLANLPDAETAVREIFGSRLAVVPFQMPGYALAKATARVFEDNPEIEGLLLLQHGHVAFSSDAKSAYDLVIEHTNMVEDWIAQKSRARRKNAPAGSPDPQPDATTILATLRGIIGDRNATFASNRDRAMPVFDLRSGANVQSFLSRPDIETLATRGVATPDHVIRTKNTPLMLTKSILQGGRPALERAVDVFISKYTTYFERNAPLADAPKTMLPPTPGLIWASGIGIIGVGADAKAAAIAGDLASQSITAISNGEDCGGFFPVPEAQVFDMEYWALEQAKLGKSTPPPLTGKIVLVTGGGGAIGLASAHAFAGLGANIFVVDQHADAVDTALSQLGPNHGGMALDVTSSDAAIRAIHACTTRFGGLDILVSNAGAAWTGEMSTLDDAVLRQSFELNFFAHQTFAKAASHVFETQGRGGQILFNVSKQAVNPGKGFGAYGLPKAATFFLLRQLALELGHSGVRVNGINADRIRSGLLDDDFIAKRATARGVDESTYMAGNLIRREVEARHVADAFVALALSERTTAHVMTVDGGNIEAALR